jgi:hypothetical protein
MTHTSRASACSIHFNGIILPIAASPGWRGLLPMGGNVSAITSYTL